MSGSIQQLSDWVASKSPEWMSLPEPDRWQVKRDVEVYLRDHEVILECGCRFRMAAIEPKGDGFEIQPSFFDHRKETCARWVAVQLAIKKAQQKLAKKARKRVLKQKRSAI